MPKGRSEENQMKETISTITWIEKFNNGEFSSKDVKVQIKAGWYDWFCKDTSLANKTVKIGNIVKQIKHGGKVNLYDTYVWFKNNCPLKGPLYDDFRIADINTGDVIFTTQIDCCWYDKKYTVYGRVNNFEKLLFETDSSKDLVNWFNEGWTL